MAARSASVKRAVDNAIRAAALAPREEATAALAKRLAAEMDATDDPKVAGDLAGRLLPVLAALGMTRTAAAGVTRGGATDGRSALDELKQRRRARADGA